jgi:hypothetical protein
MSTRGVRDISLSDDARRGGAAAGVVGLHPAERHGLGETGPARITTTELPKPDQHVVSGAIVQ